MKQTLNESKLRAIVEEKVRQFLREMNEADGIAGIPGSAEPAVEDAPAAEAPMFDEPMADVKMHIYKAFKRGGAERKAKADKYINVINNTVNATAKKHPELSADQVEFRIFNKYFDHWVGKETKAEHEAFNAQRRAEWNSEANADRRAADAQKKRDARAAAKAAAQGGEVPMMENKKKISEDTVTTAGAFYAVYRKSEAGKELVEEFDTFGAALNKMEELRKEFESQGIEVKVKKTAMSPLKYTSFYPAPSKKIERVLSFSANGEFYYIKKSE